MADAAVVANAPGPPEPPTSVGAPEYARDSAPSPISGPSPGAPHAPNEASEPLPSTEEVDGPLSQAGASVRETAESSAAEDGQPGSGPYSTRSRNRGNAPRPNYSDDFEMDFERPLTRKEIDAKARSASLEDSSKAASDVEPPRPHTVIKLHTRAQPADDAKSSSSSSRAEKNSSSPMNGENHKSDSRKRKLNRAAASKAAAASDERNAGNNARDLIPGTSQFFAAPNGSSDAPPAKKRRTGDDVVSTSRKGSSSHASNRPLSDTCVVSFERTNAMLKDGKMEADDGTIYAPDDTVYLVCEPPGDPYYICRIMEFRRRDPDDERSPVVDMLINWFYRPKDIGKFSSDPRHLFASMQSDQCPLSSLRGKCIIKHRTEITHLETFRRQRDTFHFSQLYDRYSHRPYEMIPCSTVINVPPDVKKTLDDRWRFVVVEQQAVKELTSPPKNCKLCGKYCAPNDSVDCGVCRDTFHLGCVDPPLAKRPARGFAWSCGPCSRDRERKLEQRHMTVLNDASKDSQDEATEQEEEEASAEPGIITVPDGPVDTDTTMTEQAEVTKANMWPWRYLGVHCRIEDVLQHDDRAIYPRATSRTGNKHQAEVDDWPGRPLEYMKVADAGKKAKGAAAKRDLKAYKGTLAAMQQERAEKAKRPAWIKDEPRGFVARGEDYDANDERCTAVPLFVKPVEVSVQASGFVAANAKGPPSDKMIDQYIKEAKDLAKDWDLVTVSKKGDPQISSNYLDYALNVLSKNNFNFAASLDALKAKHDPATLGNPNFTKEEIQKFENGVAKHGSDLRSVRKYYARGHTYGDVVRFYYNWKFSQRGDEIWGNHQGRKGVKKRAESSWVEIADDEDDSAFDNDKAVAKKRRFTCKFCEGRHSRQWRRAPGVAPGATVLADPKAGKDKANQLIVALCQRCANVWRRYAMVWEDPDEVAKAILSSGGRQWKRKNDEELLRELVLANEIARVPTSAVAASAAAQIGVDVTIAQEPVRKKPRGAGEKESTPTLSSSEQPKKKGGQAANLPRQPTPPPEPVTPKWRQLPCAVCRYEDSLNGDKLVSCKECKLTVHRLCYGITSSVNPAKWMCDTCLNDKQCQHSLRYECALCPVSNRPVELLEMPKNPRKKSDRDKEKERMEKEMAAKMMEDYFKEQKKRGRPIFPREALKLTASNNWMHITCAMWTPEIKFSDCVKMQQAEGMGAIAASPTRMDPVCKICRISEGSCVACHQCHAPFHVACAHDAEYIFGFDVTPVKGSRKDPNLVVTVGPETGTMTAAIWCKDHAVKTIVHDMCELVDADTGTNALQLYATTYKQADLTLTGTARKANLLGGGARTLAQTTQTGTNRRASVMANGTGAKSHQPDDNSMDVVTNGVSGPDRESRQCRTCGIGFALKWHRLGSEDTHMRNGIVAADSGAWQCHKCFMKTQQGHPVSPKREPEPEPASQPPLGPPPDLFRTSVSAPPAQYGRENLARFAEDIKSVTITLTNPTFGGLHVFRGHEFNLDLDSDPTPLYRFITYWASHKCGYDQEHDVIITEDGSWITWPKSMMQALVKMVVAGSREGHWRVVGARDTTCKVMDTSFLTKMGLREPSGVPNGAPTLPNGFPQPQPQPLAGPSPQMRAPPPAYVQHTYPAPPPPPPQTLQSPMAPVMRSGYPPHPVHGAQASPPGQPAAHGLPQPPQQTPFAPAPMGRPPPSVYAPSPLPGGPPNSPPAPDTLSLQQQQQQQRPMQIFHRHTNSGGSGPPHSPSRESTLGGGASSNPNLRNLMH